MMFRSSLLRVLRYSNTCSVFQQNCRERLQNKFRPLDNGLNRLYTSVRDNASAINQNVAGFKVDKSTDIISVQFSDNTETRYPFVWLRDNCRCSECHDKSSVHRIQLLENLDIDVHPIKTEMHIDGHSIIMQWSDDHKSEYPVNWLKDVKFPAALDLIDDMDVKYWGSEMTKEKMPRFSFHDVMSDESCLYSWLASLHTYGFSILDNLGDNDKNLFRLAEKVSYPRQTCYGEDFVVKSNPDPTNLAYTSYRLCLHTDLPFYKYEPGIQILHCIQSSEHGGSNEFADGFKVADDLRQKDPDIYDILSSVHINFVDEGKDEVANTPYVLSDWKPIIRLDEKGQIKQVNFNNHVRGVQMSVGPEDVKKVYHALATFNSALYQKDNFTSFKLKEGEAACFNNTRVLHGRSAFTVPPGSQNPRHLQGIYIDWDVIYARMRAIAADKKK
ncbi:gamma-butyrobetaine dioxygenase-like [Antedon mediterranea]|uniref:gamma-butyrobetaine dioxygenase-like n=1 Tax=Antedon mediterranea TaxID=105859 RepID=UPI003AF84D4B